MFTLSEVIVLTKTSVN